MHIEYKIDFPRIEVKINEKEIGYIERKSGYEYYFFYFKFKDLPSILLEKEISEAKEKLEGYLKLYNKTFNESK